ncbi:MAG: outer membrane beta-barrel protein [Gemmatimonadota bacterium]
MRNETFVLLAAVIAASAIPSAADAQLRPWQISLAGGPSFVTGHLAEDAGTGYHVQGSVGFDVPLLPFGVRADAFWQELPDVEDAWFRQIGGLLSGVFQVPLIVIQPYVLAGAGVIRTEAPDEAHEGHTHIGEPETTVGFNAGAGVEFPFAGLSGFLEARYINAFGSGNATNYQSIPVTVGVRF